MQKRKPELTDEQKARLYDLALLSDDHIDTSDIPEISDHSRATHGFFTARKSGKSAYPWTIS